MSSPRRELYETMRVGLLQQDLGESDPSAACACTQLVEGDADWLGVCPWQVESPCRGVDGEPGAVEWRLASMMLQAHGARGGQW